MLMIAPMMLAHQKCSKEGSCVMKIWTTPKRIANCRQEKQQVGRGLLCDCVCLNCQAIIHSSPAQQDQETR